MSSLRARRHDARVGGVDAVHVGVDVAAVRLQRRRQRHRRRVRAAAAQRGDAVVRRRCPGSRPPPAPGRAHAADQFGAVDAVDAGRAVRAVGAQRDLPACPGARLDADLLQRDGQQAGGDLLAGRHHGVVFARVVQRRQRLAPADELVGDAGHGGDHHGDLVAGSTSRFTRAATLRMRSRSATEVPPNFITMRAIRRLPGRSATRAPARRSLRRAASGAHILIGGGGGNHGRTARQQTCVGRRRWRVSTRWRRAGGTRAGPMRPLHRMNPLRIGWIDRASAPASAAGCAAAGCRLRRRAGGRSAGAARARRARHRRGRRGDRRRHTPMPTARPGARPTATACRGPAGRRRALPGRSPRSR